MQRRIKLIWGASKVVHGRWYFGLVGLYERVEGERDSGVAISVRGLLVALGAAGVLAYLAGALALATFWQRSPYSLLTYGDAIWYPVRRAVVADKKGRAYLAEGWELWRAGKWVDSARLLTLGLSLHPADNRARFTLAQFHALAHQRAQAGAVLRAGLTGEYPGRSYLQGVFDLAEQGEDFAFIVLAGDRYLPLLNSGQYLADRRWLAARKFSALLAAKRTEEALAFAATEASGSVAVERRVLALLELGRSPEAAVVLDEWAGRTEADQAQMARLRARVFREAGRWEEMERALGELRAQTPDDAGAAIYGVVQCAMAGREAAARQRFDDFVFRFGGTAANYLLLAEPLADIGERRLLEQCIQAAAERGNPVQPLNLLLVFACVRRGEWADAAGVLDRLKPIDGISPQKAATDKATREWMRALLDAVQSPHDAAKVLLVGLLRDHGWSIKIYRQTIESLRRAGRGQSAADVLALAEVRFPASTWIRTQRAEVAQELAARGSPRDAVPPVAATRGGIGPEAFFQELNQLLRDKKWTEADQAIRRLRTRVPPPVWLDRRDADFRLAEVRVGQGRSDTPAMLAAARIFVNGDADRAKRMLEVANEIHRDGDTVAAIALAEVVLRKSPDSAPAQKLLAELRPQAPR